MTNFPRYLITTADERSWVFDRPVLFLGEWCRLYNRKHIWSRMDSIVAEPYGLETHQKKRDLYYVHVLSNHLLSELTVALNTFHHTEHHERYWNIVLGHWLQRYVAVTFNRYFALELALKNYQVSGTTIYDTSSYSLVTEKSIDFIWACNDDVWNHVFYSKILNFLESTKEDVDPEPLRGLSGFQQGRNRKHKSNFIRNLIQTACSTILTRFSRKNDAFIINSYLPKSEEIKLQISLGQFPQLWRSPPLERIAYDQVLRQRLLINTKGHTGFERFVRLQIGEMIPTCYLEGYSQLIQQTKSLPWPSEPKFIFTSNNFDTDEIFKAWVALKSEQGFQYFAGQHGGRYGKDIDSPYRPELVTSDKVFTWGWQGGSQKNIPAFVFKTAGQRFQRNDPDGNLLLVQVHAPHRLGPEDSYHEFGIYQEEQFRFIAQLPGNIQQNLTVRLHSAYRNFNWSDEQRWKDRYPHASIETGAASIRELIARSRLVVHSYDSTGILETLALNIPTICFWQGGLDHLLDGAKPYYELLRGANILADTPEQAAGIVSLHWGNIKGWWESQKVQDARQAFCMQYARTENNPISTLKRLLVTHSDKKKSN